MVGATGESSYDSRKGCTKPLQGLPRLCGLELALQSPSSCSSSACARGQGGPHVNSSLTSRREANSCVGLTTSGWISPPERAWSPVRSRGGRLSGGMYFVKSVLNGSV